VWWPSKLAETDGQVGPGSDGRADDGAARRAVADPGRAPA